jgi:hypothetical protein
VGEIAQMNKEDQGGKRIRVFDLLDADDYAVIGQAVVSFSYIEHELARAAIGISKGLVDLENNNRILKDSVHQSFKRRAEFFAKVYCEVIGNDDWIKAMNDNLRFANRFRDQFAHGIWTKLPDGRLSVEFFSRYAAERGEISDILDIPRLEVQKIANSNIKLAEMLYQKFAPLPDIPL